MSTEKTEINKKISFSRITRLQLQKFVWVAKRDGFKRIIHIAVGDNSKLSEHY